MPFPGEAQDDLEMAALTFAMVARVPEAGLDDYGQYVDLLMSSLHQHGGDLEHRYAFVDATVEILIFSLPSASAFEMLQTDAHVREAAPLLYRPGAHVETFAPSRAAPAGR